MTCEHLVCAVCAGPVVEGRCATCRISRAHVHGAIPFWLSRQALAVLVAVLTVLWLLAANLN